jgi:hypothetical protein
MLESPKTSANSSPPNKALFTPNEVGFIVWFLLACTIFGYGSFTSTASFTLIEQSKDDLKESLSEWSSYTSAGVVL